MRIKITNVDMFGSCGRDYHPEPSDVGKVLAVQSLEVFVFDYHCSVVTERDKGYVNCLWNPEYVTYMYTGLTADGRKLQLIDFEVEVL